jgi:pilus assembly protein CpaF
MFTVVITNKSGSEQVISCEIDNCSIGKGDDNLIVLQGWTVSRTHAGLQNRQEGIFVVDGGSKWPVKVNGQIVLTEFGPIGAGDKIQIGDYFITVTRPSAYEVGVSEPSVVEKKVIASSYTEPAALQDPVVSSIDTSEINKVRGKIHKELILQMDLRRFDVTTMDETELWDKTTKLVKEIINKEASITADIDKEKLAKSVVDEAIGLGCLEELLADPTVSEIMVNRFDEIFIEAKGKLTKSDICFTNEQAVVSAIERIVSPLGRRIDESSPMVDARLADGSRVNAVIPPLALKGSNITIRKFSKNKLHGSDLVKFGSISEQMVEFAKVAVMQRVNIVISGGTGSGKTTLLNVLSNFIPDDQRIITCEDAAELKLGQSNLISLESRPPNAEGKGAIHIRDLVKNCLRMRPDRIVIGECRGGEALDMLQAMNTGHDGSLTTVHANTPRDAISRIETMVMMAGMDLPITAIREQIASAVGLIIQQSRFHDGSRKVTYITEITGMESGLIQMQDIFRFQQEGISPEGKVLGHYVATGAIPEFYETLKRNGTDLDLSIFAKG